jgi:hypothetical protein
LFGFEVGFVFEVFQRTQSEVEKIAAAAGGVEHFKMLEPFEIDDEGALRFLQGILRAFAAFFIECHTFGYDAFCGFPFCRERLDDHRIDNP